MLNAHRRSAGTVRRCGNRIGLISNGLTAATALTVNDFAADQIFQRVGTSKAVTVSGTYSGPASVIKARAVPHGTSIDSTDYAWTTITINPEGGTYSGSLLVQQGGWYNIQVRDGLDVMVNAAGSNQWGVGIVVALLGQSNMRNLSQNEAEYPLSDLLTRRFASGAWSHVGNYDATETFPAGTPFSTYGATYASVTPRGDGVVYFANRLRAALGIPVGTLEYAVSGSAIAGWQPSGGAQWGAFASALAAASGDCEAAIWLQGEENANAGTSGASYQASLLSLLNGLHAATGRNAANFHFGVVALGPGTTYAAEGNMGVIRAAHLAFVAAHAADGVYLGAVATDADLAGDAIHFATASQVRMGRRYAEGLLWRLGGAAKAGPYITGATRAGAVVTVAIAHDGGTALMDGAGGSGGSLQGFRVFDDGVVATISATSISGDTVVLTLSATPSGAVTLDYAMANAPYGSSTAAAEVVYDNNTVPGDTLGLPLRPCALIAVA